MIYRLDIKGLKLPRVNEVLRWSWRKRAKEIKRVRDVVGVVAAGEGHAKIKPATRAQVTITAWGPYERRDGDATWFKDVLDAIVARPVSVTRNVKVRRWGYIVDDSPRIIGKPKLQVRLSKMFSVVIVIGC